MNKIPEWCRTLCGYYVVIRVDGRNKSLRRRWYRKVEKEKLRLAELGINQIKIKAMTRYLAALNNTYKRAACIKIEALLEEPEPQLTFDFNEEKTLE